MAIKVAADVSRRISVGTNTLVGGSSYLSDPEWTNYPARFYRLRSP